MTNPVWRGGEIEPPALIDESHRSLHAPSPITYRRIMEYAGIITLELGKRGGKPCIRSLRITVYDVLEYLASGMSHAEVLAALPYLVVEDILACLAFGADRERRVELLNV